MEKRANGFFKDTFLNVIAFGIYIFSQQIVLIPHLAKTLSVEQYGHFILFVTVMNVAISVLGGQIGIAHQLDIGNDDKMITKHDDYGVMIALSSVLIVIGFPVFLALLEQPVEIIVGLTISVVLANYRLYIRYVFRSSRSYTKTAVQNIFYFAGMFSGLIFARGEESFWIPILIGELSAFAYTIFVVPFDKSFINRTEKFKQRLKKYLGLGFSDLLTSSGSLIDKLLIYPLLGAYQLAVYSAGGATGKVASLVMTPLNEVILVRLAKAKEDGASRLVRTAIMFSIVAVIAISLLLIPCIYFLTFVLYKQYLDDVLSIVILLAIACSVRTVSSVLKNVIITYAKVSKLAVCYAINLLVLAIGGVIGARTNGLIGFAVSVVIAQCALWLSFVVVLGVYSRKTDEQKN